MRRLSAALRNSRRFLREFLNVLREFLNALRLMSHGGLPPTLQDIVHHWCLFKFGSLLAQLCPGKNHRQVFDGFVSTDSLVAIFCPRGGQKIATSVSGGPHEPLVAAA